jgi:photosystem II stability/assembly factor-like uncharacterized protein
MTNTIENSTRILTPMLVFSLSMCFLSVACNKSAKTQTSKSGEGAPSSIPVSQQRVATFERVIRHDDSLLWKSRTKLLPNQESLTSIQFLDQENGWIGTHDGTLYRTSNGGKEWQRIKVPIPKEAYISSLFFINISNGWIACGLKPSDVLESRGNRVWIFRTRDGGQNWSQQYYNEGVQLLRVRFSNQQDGWAVGRQFDNAQTIPFLIKTTDDGAHWVDVSANLPATGSSNVATDIYANGPSDATILTGNGELFRTLDGGQVWQRLAALQNEPEQTYMGRLLKLPTGTFLAVGGSDSLEGLWGVLTQREPDGAFKLYRTNCYISDLLSISETNLLAAGHIIESASELTTARRQGVILHSSDGGLTWSIVYRGTVPLINAMTLSHSNSVWAVGERGLVLNLTIP